MNIVQEENGRADRSSFPALAENGIHHPAAPNETDSEHFVQFYEDDEYLIESVAAFVGGGLGAGDGAIVIATPQHRGALAVRLAAQGIDVDAVCSRGQYVPLDAAETLAKFMVRGSPDETLFKKVIGELIVKTSKGRRGLRAFGEMVALLWADGHGAAAIRLEELWNDLAREHAFSLFCAYPMNGFRSALDGESFHHICQEHSRVIPAESFSRQASTDDERSRTIALLQQKAAVLEAEIAERKVAQETLARREQELRDFLETAVEGIHQAGPDGTILWANKAELELLGYTAEEYIGRSITEFHADENVIADILTRLRRGEKLRNYEARLKHKDGSIRYVSINSSAQWDGDRFVHTKCFTRDITEKKLAEEALARSRQELATQVEDLQHLHDRSARLIAIGDSNELSEEVLRAGLAVSGANRGLLSFFDAEEQVLKTAAAVGFNAEFLDYVKQVPIGAGVCGQCFKEKKRAIVEDVELDPLFAPYRDAAKLGGFRAVYSTPLIVQHGKIIGVLSMYFAQPHRPSEREIRLMELYARHAADAMESARLRDQASRELKGRQQTEAVLRQTQETERAQRIELQTLMEAVPAVVWIAHDPECRHITGNRAGYEFLRAPLGSNLLRTPPEEGAGRFEVFKDGHAVPDSEWPMRIVARTGKALRGEEIEYRFADGTSQCLFGNVVPVLNPDGSVRGVVATFLDVTDWKKGQEAAQRLAAIVESSDDAIVSKDLNGIITSWNNGAERLFGYTEEEIIGKPVTVLMPPERFNEEPGILDRIRRGQRIEHYETVRKHKDGTLLNISLTVSPIKDMHGKVIGASKVARDITDKVHAKERLEHTVAERTAQLRDTVAELEAFSYSIAHDMRAPLRSMNSYSRLIEEDFAEMLPPKGRDYIHRIAAGAGRLDALITDVLNYSRISRSEMPLETVDVEKLTRDIIDSYENLRESGATILVQSPLPRVVGNPAALTQTISNLLSNAVKFVRPGTASQVRIWAEKKSDFIRLWFEDNGLGISEEGQKRIFHMFQRLNPTGEFEGTGIGLTIVRKAVERMGGRVGVVSQPGVGSRFWIELKRAA